MIGRRFADFLGQLRSSGSAADSARLAAILELNRALAGAQDRGALLRLLLDSAIALFGAERGFVILGSDVESRHVAAARTLDREAVRHPERKLSSSILARCWSQRSAVFCEDAQEGDFGGAQSVADMSLRSVLCAPLWAADEIVGCLYLDHRFRSGVFGDADLPWLLAFADQAAIALHLHQLLADNRDYASALAVRNEVLEEQVEQQERELAAGVARDELAHDYADIVGVAPVLVRSLQLLERTLPGDYPVMLVGESGTGKELFARAIHRYGPRSGGPFVAINVAAIQPALLESELFGHVRGAYSGASEARGGLLRQAAGGVLFLDELAEMEIDLQAKVLRFLDDRVVRPVGGDVGEVVDLRVVAATNRDPDIAVADGLLRLDLLYRLAVVTIDLPPLRARRRDIPLLAASMLAAAAAARGGVAKTLTSECAAEIARRPWPGNVRQLRNEMLRLDALAPTDTIGADLLAPVVAAAEADDGELNLAALERTAVRRAVERAGGNKAEAARLLGISRRALYNKLGRN